jgi:hypothetical protein
MSEAAEDAVERSRRVRRRIVVTTLVLALPVAVWLTYRGTLDAARDAPMDDRAFAALRRAVASGNVVATCRDAVGDDGALRDASLRGRFTLFGDDGDLAAAVAGRRLVVVHVHGYNMTLAEGIEQGNDLWDGVRESDPTVDPATTAFLTFLWRGHFGAERFQAAQASADASAAAFAGFVAEIRAAAPECRLVVIAHSLGARVVLESLADLRAREAREWIDVLALVQPAVELNTVCTWSVRPQGGVVGRPPETRRGRYVESLVAARAVVATMSSHDAVLAALFPFGRSANLNPNPTALGFPELSLEGSAGGRTGSAFWLDCRLDPRVARLDLSPAGPDLARLGDGHTPIFGPFGRAALRVLWSRIVELLGS